MGEVALGCTQGFAGHERLVALKRLRPRRAVDVHAVEMLLDEARLSAAVRHACVVSVEDVLFVDGQFVLVMPFIEGCSLAQVMLANADEPVPEPIACAIVLDVLAGLHAIHEATDPHGRPLDIVHQDASPGNVLLGLDGTARVSDLGVASARSVFGEGERGGHGTLSCMAPEQLLARPTDRRADVFAAASLGWRLVTGQPAFPGTARTIRRRLANLRRGPARPIDRPSSDSVRSLLDRFEEALSFEPGDRPESALTFARAVARTVRPASRVEIADWVASLETAIRLPTPLPAADRTLDGAEGPTLSSRRSGDRTARVVSPSPW
jgi:serine/threonine protein kinase